MSYTLCMVTGMPFVVPWLVQLVRFNSEEPVSIESIQGLCHHAGFNTADHVASATNIGFVWSGPHFQCDMQHAQHMDPR